MKMKRRAWALPGGVTETTCHWSVSGIQHHRKVACGDTGENFIGQDTSGSMTRSHGSSGRGSTQSDEANR